MKNGNLMRRPKYFAMFFSSPIFFIFWFFLVFLSNQSHSSQPITVVDFLGREVTLPKPAQRIIALAPHVVENLYSAGAYQKIVAAVEYSDFPEGASDLPRVGGAASISIEAIVKLQPDLVVAWTSGLGLENLRKLEALGVKVYASEPKTLDDIPKTIRDLGELSGTFETADASAKKFEKTRKELNEQHLKKTRRSVFYQVWSHPLLSINKNQMIHHVIELCGGVNIFSESIATTPKISAEAVLLHNPHVIITASKTQTADEALKRWSKYAKLSAVEKGHLYVINPDLISRPTARVLLGAKQICSAIGQSR